MDACIAAYLTETYGERDFVRTGTAGQPNLLAFGNDQMLVDLSAATLTVVLPAHGPDSKVPLRTATLPFPIQPTLGRRVTNDVTLVDAATGTVRTVSRVGSPGGAGLCPVVERIWAAHRTRKDLLILTVRLYNPGSQLVSLPISLPAAPAPFRSLTLNQSTARVLVHDLETDAAGKKVVAVLIVPTILDQLTAPPARSVEHSLLISVTVLPHLHVQSPAVLTPLLLESNKLMGMVATLRHNHEKAWDTMVPFRMALPHDWELSPVFHGAMYYLSLPLHGRALPSVSMDVGDCGEQRPLRDASIYPAIPTNLDSLVAFQQQWANTLHHLPCMLPTSGSFQLALLRAFFYAVSGVRVQAGGLRVQPSWDLPPGWVHQQTGSKSQTINKKGKARNEKGAAGVNAGWLSVHIGLAFPFGLKFSLSSHPTAAFFLLFSLPSCISPDCLICDYGALFF